MRNIEFVPKAFEEYRQWIDRDRKTALRIGDLIRIILTRPFPYLKKYFQLTHVYLLYFFLFSFEALLTIHLLYPVRKLGLHRLTPYYSPAIFL